MDGDGRDGQRQRASGNAQHPLAATHTQTQHRAISTRTDRPQERERGDLSADPGLRSSLVNAAWGLRVLIRLGIAPHTLALSLLNPHPLIGYMHPYVIVKATPDGPATGFPTGNSPPSTSFRCPPSRKKVGRRPGVTNTSRRGLNSASNRDSFGVWCLAFARLFRGPEGRSGIVVGSVVTRCVDRGSFGEWICGLLRFGLASYVRRARDIWDRLRCRIKHSSSPFRHEIACCGSFECEHFISLARGAGDSSPCKRC